MAKLALDGLAKRRKAHAPPHTKRAQHATVHRIRSGDDCISTGSASHRLAHAVNPLVTQWRGERGLERSPTHPPLTALEDGCDFLGQPLRTYAGTRRIKPARTHRHRCLGHLRAMVQATKPTTAGQLMAQRKPVMRGWAHSHRHVVRQATCITVETAICRRLGSWATRRPPKTSGRGVGSKTFARTTDAKGPSWGQARVPRGTPTTSRSVVQGTCPCTGRSNSQAQHTRMTPKGKGPAKNASA